jgi:hypothetical protein
VQELITYTVRQVHRGFWTYDLCYRDEGCRMEYSVGECHSRRDAEKQAKSAVKAAFWPALLSA